jgi:hypothetical protein
MESALITALAPYGPVALIGGLVLVLYRQQIMRALSSDGQETGVEKALSAQLRLLENVEKLMAAQMKTYEHNMEMFEDTNQHLKDIEGQIREIRTTLNESVSVSRSLLQETMRGNRL